MSTDVLGYRNNQGGGNSASPAVDPAAFKGAMVEQQYKRILLGKTPLLESPGFVLEGLYPDASNTSVTAVEMQETFAKDRISGVTVMGSTSSFWIPSVNFGSGVFLYVSLPPATWPENSVGSATEGTTTSQVPESYFYAPEGWLFNAVRTIVLYVGASNIAQIELSGVASAIISLVTCETYEKRSKLIVGGGKYLNSMDSASPLAAVANNKPIFRNKFSSDVYFRQNDDPFLREAIIPIRLPWTTCNTLNPKPSFDYRLTTQPIQITIQWKKNDEIIKTNNPAILSQFQNFEFVNLVLFQQELSDKSMSLRQELLAMPNYNVGWPFQYPQTYPIVLESANDTGLSDQIFSVNLTSIINADLTTMVFGVQWNGQFQNPGPFVGSKPNIDGGSYNPLMFQELYDFELVLNGQRLFYFGNGTYDFAQLLKQMDKLHFEITHPFVSAYQGFGQQGGEAPAAHWSKPSIKEESKLYELNFSQLRALLNESHLMNTPRFQNQTFQLRFKINRSKGFDSADTSEVPKNRTGFVMNVIYLYNGILLVGGDGGASKLITN